MLTVKENSTFRLEYVDMEFVEYVVDLKLLIILNENDCKFQPFHKYSFFHFPYRKF